MKLSILCAKKEQFFINLQSDQQLFPIKMIRTDLVWFKAVSNLREDSEIMYVFKPKGKGKILFECYY